MCFLVLKFGICGQQGREKPTFVDDVPATPHNMSAFAWDEGFMLDISRNCPTVWFGGLWAEADIWWCNGFGFALVRSSSSAAMCSRRTILMESSHVHTLCQTILNTDEYRSNTMLQWRKHCMHCIALHHHTLYCTAKSCTALYDNALWYCMIVHCFVNIYTVYTPCIFPSERVADNALDWDRSYFTLTPSTAPKCPFVTFIK